MRKQGHSLLRSDTDQYLAAHCLVHSIDFSIGGRVKFKTIIGGMICIFYFPWHLQENLARKGEEMVVLQQKPP
ncbi:hypothetical protein SUGI_0702970 [Cryptomeria japonica]|nr:hypothetical protein SUGI_0702970 [Cryptomeria japonica]